MMKVRVLTGLVIALGLVFGAALPVSGVTAYVATLSGAEEVPPLDTPASGGATFVLSEDGGSLSYTLGVTGIQDVFAAHIHLAPAGSNGPVVAGLFAGPMAGSFTGVLAQGTIIAADLIGPLAGMDLSALVAEIEAGNTYVNVHTMAHKPGELRGQIRVDMGM